MRKDGAQGADRTAKTLDAIAIAIATAVGAANPRTVADPVPWPKPVGPELPGRRPTSSRAAWLRLYDVADHTTRCALGPHLDTRSVQQLLLWQQPSAELRTHLIQSLDAAAIVGIASDWNTPPEVIEELNPYNDPESKPALFLHTDLTPEQRRHVPSGFPAQSTVAFLARVLAPGDSPGTDPGPGSGFESEEVGEARREVAALVAEHLGDDPECWALALRLIPEFEGTLPDLLLASGAVMS